MVLKSKQTCSAAERPRDRTVSSDAPKKTANPESQYKERQTSICSFQWDCDSLGDLPENTMAIVSLSNSACGSRCNDTGERRCEKISVRHITATVPLHPDTIYLCDRRQQFILHDGQIHPVAPVSVAELATPENGARAEESESERLSVLIAHDLREPLRSIRGYTTLLASQCGGHLDETGRDYLDRIAGGVEAVQRLVDSVLTFGTIGAVAKRREETDLTGAAEDAAARLHSLIDRTGAKLDMETLPHVVADPDQMVIVFQNLIENAIKYRSSKPPYIRITARETPESWIVAISDNGIGISEESGADIFKIFTREGLRPEIPGSGLGLAIVRKIVEGHKGRIWVESSVGEGSTFSFSIGK